MKMMRKIFNWLLEPSKTKAEKWAINNGVYDQYKKGYEFKIKNAGEEPEPQQHGSLESIAYGLGVFDADRDIERQW